MEISAHQQPKTNYGPFLNRDFLLYWIGTSFSALGDHFFETTLILWIASDLASGKSWAPMAVSGLLVSSVIPTILLGPFAGVFADRWIPRRTMLLTTLISSAMVLTPVLLLTPLAKEFGSRFQIAGIYVSVLLASIVVQFLRPSSARLLKSIIPDEDLPRASSLTQTSSSIAILAGPALAAPVFVAVGPIWGLVINAASFFLASLAVFLVRCSESHSEGSLQETSQTVLEDLSEGIRYFRRSRVLSAVTVRMVAAMVGVNMVASLEVFFVVENLNATEELFGLLSTAEGVGMIGGAFVGVLVAPRLNMGKLLWSSVALLGVAIFIYSRATSIWPALLVLVVIGVLTTLISVALMPLVLQQTPARYVGRVNAILNPLIFSGAVIGMLSGGLLYSLWQDSWGIRSRYFTLGPLDSIFALSALICITAALVTRMKLKDV